jgi:hypothetical protein
MSVGIAGFTVRHQQTFRDADAEAKGGLVRSDFNSVTTRFTAVRKTLLGSVRVEGQRQRRSADTSGYTVHSVQASIALPPRKGINSSLGGSWRQTTGGVEVVRVWTASASASWAATPGLTIYGRLDGFTLNRGDESAERYVGFTLEATTMIGMMNTVLRYDHQRRAVAVDGVLHRLTIRALRRF